MSGNQLTLRTYDQAVQYTACLVVARSAGIQELQNQLVMFRQTAFYTRYGDIFAEVCTKLKTEPDSKKVGGWHMLQKHSWTEIDANFTKQQADAYGRILAGESYWES